MTLIVIVIDGKQYCSFDGELEQWMHEQYFKVVNQKLQISLTEVFGPPTAIKVKRLKIFGNVHIELEMTLALFCYDMVNPTRRRVEDDMHIYQVEQYRNKSR